MARHLSAIVVLLLVCSIAGLAATVLPVAGSYALTGQSGMDVMNFQDLSKEAGTYKKPDDLKLDIPMLDSVFYYAFRLGEEARPYYMVFGRSNSKCINTAFFDANGDKVIAKDEAVPMTYFFDFWTDRKVDIWFSEPLWPLRAEIQYKRADGTVLTKTITFLVQPISTLAWGDTKGEPGTGLFVKPSTWFVGEVTAAGDRVMKAAVVDGNMNGLFNEAGKDFLLLDSNFDGRFDWGKEKTAIGGSGISGLGSDGKRAKLIPFVAAWPQKLVLAPKGTTPDPAQLEQ